MRNEESIFETLPIASMMVQIELHHVGLHQTRKNGSNEDFANLRLTLHRDLIIRAVIFGKAVINAPNGLTQIQGRF